MRKIHLPLIFPAVNFKYFFFLEVPTHEFIIYDSAVLKKKNGHPKGSLILACINKMGHGIVYDRYGRIRLVKKH